MGNPEKAKTVLGWQPEVSFEELVYMMMEADLRLVHDEIKGVDHGSDRVFRTISG